MHTFLFQALSNKHRTHATKKFKKQNDKAQYDYRYKWQGRKIISKTFTPRRKRKYTTEI
jgi:hypothetical protein